MSGIKHIELPIRLGYRGIDIGCENAKIGGYVKLLDVRGWGYLNGNGDGALGLSHEEAAAEQEAFSNLVVEAVNSYASSLQRISELEAEVARLRGALLNISFTVTEDSHGNTKDYPVSYYRGIARDALSPPKLVSDEGAGE